MKRNIILGTGVIATFLTLTQPVVINSFLGFMFLGIIPGTDVIIPFWVAFLSFIIGSMLLIGWLLTQPLYIGSIAAQEQTAREIARKRVVAGAHSTKSAKLAKRRFVSVKSFLKVSAGSNTFSPKL